MKVLTIPLDLKNFGRIFKLSITTKAVVIEAATLVLVIGLLFAFFSLLALIMDVHAHRGVVVGSLTSLLGGKPNRRKATPNFKIIADMGSGVKLPSRKQMQSEDEEHMWTKYPSLMLKKVLGGVA